MRLQRPLLFEPSIYSLGILPLKREVKFLPYSPWPPCRLFCCPKTSELNFSCTVFMSIDSFSFWASNIWVWLYEFLLLLTSYIILNENWIQNYLLSSHQMIICQFTTSIVIDPFRIMLKVLGIIKFRRILISILINRISKFNIRGNSTIWNFIYRFLSFKRSLLD